MADRKLENNSPEKNLESIDDRSKTQEELIAELAQLRNEVASLKDSLYLSRPIIPSSVETIPEIDLSEFPPSDTPTLLLLDDSETDRATYRRFLLGNSEKDCNIVEFDSAEEALIWCQDHTPNILLIDYLLPGINGLEFLLKLRERVEYRQILCIMMTGQENQELAVQLLKNGAEDVLDKNRMTSEGLKRSIANVLQRSFLLRQQEFQWKGRSLIETIAFHSTDKSSELAEIFQYTVNGIRKLLQCDRLVIYQLQPDGSGKIITESVFNSTFSLLGKEIQDNCLTQDQKWKEWYLQGKITSIEDILVNPHHSSCYQEFLEQIQVRAKLSVPILQDGQLWGLIIAHQCNNPKPWLKAEVELLKQIALQISLAIQAVTLSEKAEQQREERQKIEKIINDLLLMANN